MAREGLVVIFYFDIIVDALFLELDLELCADGRQKGLKVVEEIHFCHPELEVEEIQKLPFHQVNFCQTEAKAVITLDTGVSGPVFILGTRIVQVFGCQD